MNREGAGNLAAAAVGASVVYISTDHVFDGKKREPYVESDAASPLSAYGESKLRPIPTEHYRLPARRPPYSVLRSTHGARLPPWQEGLGRYLGERGALVA